MRAVFFNEADVRLGEKTVSDRCLVVEFGGGIFAHTEKVATLDGGGLGVVFQQTYIDVVRDLDIYKPRKKRPGDVRG